MSNKKCHLSNFCPQTADSEAAGSLPKGTIFEPSNEMNKMRHLLGFIIMTASSFGWTQVRSQMTLFNDSFLSTNYESTAARQFQYLGLQLKNREGESDYFQIDMEGAVAFGAPLLSYIKVDE